jgi:hypothetical protein
VKFLFSWPGTILAVIVILSLEIAPRAEGLVLPVIRAAVIDKATPERGGVVVEGRARKVRDCDFHTVEWYLTAPDTDTEVRVPVQFRTPPVVSPVGEFSFGPWWVGVRPDQVPLSRVEVLYRCHWFWLTRMDIFVGISALPPP